jgi:hypothetical protein
MEKLKICSNIIVSPNHLSLLSRRIFRAFPCHCIINHHFTNKLRLLCLLVSILFAPIEALSLPAHPRRAIDNNKLVVCSRRRLLSELIVSIPVLAVLSAPSSCSAASEARVETWPSLEYLEPIFEFQLSLQALAEVATDESKYPLLQQRLEKFFSGGIVSERNCYAGLGVQYMRQIQYDKNELTEYIRLDKAERFKSMEDALNDLKNLLASLKTKTQDSQVVQDYSNRAKLSLARWFALVSRSDVERVERLFGSARAADANRNGKLEKEELESMLEEDRVLWQKRIDYIGG